jgi:hypothetical protein
MKAELIALSLVAKLMAASLLMSTVAMALGAFAVVSPRRAAEIWASQRLQNITPERKRLDHTLVPCLRSVSFSRRHARRS